MNEADTQILASHRATCAALNGPPEIPAEVKEDAMSTQPESAEKRRGRIAYNRYHEAYKISDLPALTWEQLGEIAPAYQEEWEKAFANSIAFFTLISLHDSIQEMHARIKELEEALSAADRILNTIRNAPGTTLNPVEISQEAYYAHEYIRSVLAAAKPTEAKS